MFVGASRRHEQAQAEHGQHDSGNHNAMHAQALLIPNANDELVTVAKAAIMLASFDDQALCTHRIHTTDMTSANGKMSSKSKGKYGV
jgi:hypothetical protein